MTVLWDTRAIETRPSGKRRESYVDVQCDACGEVRRVTMSTAKRSTMCKPCQQADALMIAAARSMKRLKAIAAHQLANPSKPEQQVAEWLDAWGYAYERQHIFLGEHRAYIIDFVVGDVAIEVNGYHHIRPAIMKRDDDLCDDWRGEVVFLDAMNLNDAILAQAILGK